MAKDHCIDSLRGRTTNKKMWISLFGVNLNLSWNTRIWMKKVGICYEVKGVSLLMIGHRSGF